LPPGAAPSTGAAFFFSFLAPPSPAGVPLTAAAAAGFAAAFLAPPPAAALLLLLAAGAAAAAARSAWLPAYRSLNASTSASVILRNSGVGSLPPMRCPGGSSAAMAAARPARSSVSGGTCARPSCSCTAAVKEGMKGCSRAASSATAPAQAEM
jgi:hypothetical protein